MSRVEAVQVAGEAADGAEAEPVIIGAAPDGRVAHATARSPSRARRRAVETGGELPHLTPGGGQREAE